MNKASLVLLIILLQIGVANAGIEVRNATTVWNATFVTGSSVNLSDRIVVEQANTIYTSNLSIGPDPSVSDRIVIDHANALFNPYLMTAPSDFNPNVTPRIIIRSANNLWSPKLGLSGIAFVDIRNFAFNKSVITIPVDTTVTWINFDSVAHTVTADDGSFDSGNLQTNQSFSRTFNVSGTFAYHCSIHPSMTGSVIVTSANLPLGSISNPHVSRGTTWINWSWNNPPDTDFSHVMVYIDGSFAANVSAPLNYYNATGFALNTTHTISTRTVDTAGNINQNWVNHTAMTYSSEGAKGRYDFDNSGRIEKSEAVQAVLDYFDSKITKAEAIEVVLAYFGGA